MYSFIHSFILSLFIHAAHVIRCSDAPARMMLRQVDTIDRNFSTMAGALQYAIETEHKVADRQDALARHMHVYGEEETVGIKSCLTKIAQCLEQVQDYRRAQVLLSQKQEEEKKR